MRNKQENVNVHILVACRDVGYAIALVRHLEGYGYELERCHDAKSVLRLGCRKVCAVIVLDLDLSEESDLDLVSYLRRQCPDTRVILLFDVAKIERAVDGIRHGAYLYLPKTSQPADVALVVSKAIRDRNTEAALNEYEQNFLGDLVGNSPAMIRVVELISKVAPTDSTVLLLGESGTGKEVLANTIHRLSLRRDMPFVAVNCAALPEALLESELFGHVKGAFTGAHADKRGLFEEADGGTMLLDEVADMSLVTQAKLLRVLQNGEVRSVGSPKSKRVNVRVIGATNRDLVEAVASNQFREDLYFRLNVIQIHVPPLRERMEALPALTGRFVQRFSARFGKRVHNIDEHAQALLTNYTYPGNIRELESIIAHAVIMSEDGVIRARDLPDHVRQGIGSRLALPNYAANSIPTLSQMEEQLIRSALEKLDGNQTKAAKRLGISRSTLWRKMKEYDIAPRGETG